MSKQYVYFEELPVNAVFSLAGNSWVKRSSRTADLPEYDRWFYMGKWDLCIVGNYSRLSDDYFGD